MQRDRFRSSWGNPHSAVTCDLEWPRKTGREGSFSSDDLLNNTRTVWPRVTKFGSITRGEGRISIGSATPLPQGAGPKRNPVFVVLYLCLHPLTQNDQIRMVTRWEGRVLGQWRRCICTKASRGLLAIAEFHIVSYPTLEGLDVWSDANKCVFNA